MIFYMISFNAIVYIAFFIETLFLHLLFICLFAFGLLKVESAAYDIQLRTANDGCIMH